MLRVKYEGKHSGRGKKTRAQDTGEAPDDDAVFAPDDDEEAAHPDA